MKHIDVTSLFLLFIILFLACACEQQKDNRSRQLSREIDSLYATFTSTEDPTKSINEKLKTINSFIKKSIELDVDSLVFKGYLRKTALLADSSLYDRAIVSSEKMLARAVLKKDTTHILKSYNKLTLYNSRLNDYIKAIENAQHLLLVAKSYQDSTQIAKAYGKLGRYFKEENKDTEAFYNYNEAFKLYRDLDSLNDAGKTLHSMAKIQKSLGDYIGSRTTATDGIKYLENTNNIKDRAGLSHIISVSFKEQKQLHKAFKWNKLALSLYSEKAMSTYILSIFQTTKANLLADSLNYDEAINILENLLKEEKLKKSKKEYPRVLNNLGYIKWRQNPNNKASKDSLLKSLRLREKINDISGLISSNMNLAEYYLKSDSIISIKYAEAAYRNARIENSLPAVKEALNLLINLKANPKKEAKEMGLVTKKLDSINNGNQELFSATKYENEKLFIENAEKQLEIEKRKKEKNLWAFAALGVMFVSFSIIFHLRQKNRQRIKISKIEGAYEAEVDMSKKIHDELANDVSDVMNYVNNGLQLSSEKTTPLLNKLEDIYLRTRDISTESGNIDFTNFSESLKHLLIQHNTNNVQIIFNPIETLSWQKIPDYKKMVIYRCLQELMVNMKKHSHANSVTIAFRNDGLKNEIRYTDDGKGATKETIKSNGLLNVETRMQTIGGSFSFDTSEGNGFKAKLKFES